jgi:hypothetical protein
MSTATHYERSDLTVNNVLETTLKEALVAQFKVLSQHLTLKAEENHKN